MWILFGIAIALITLTLLVVALSKSKTVEDFMYVNQDGELKTFYETNDYTYH